MKARVTIDGVEYAPMSVLSKDANETAKAIIRMIVGGYYTHIHCHVDGGEAKQNCDCSACNAHKLAMQFLGLMDTDSCNEEPIIEDLLLQLK